MMKIIVIALVAAFIGSGSCQVPLATAQCVKDQGTNNVRMTFNLNVPTGQPRGFLWPIDYNQFMTYNNLSMLTGCTDTFIDGAWRVVSTISDNNNGPKTIDNACGVTVMDNGNNPDEYVWLFHSAVVDNGLVTENDYVWVVVCNETNIASNVVTGNIQVLTPNLVQRPVILDLDVVLEVLVEDANGNFNPATTAKAGDRAKLRLRHTRQVPFNALVHPYGVYGLSTYVGPSASFPTNIPNDFLFDIYGCAYNGLATRRARANDRIPPFTAVSGYTGIVSGSGDYYYSTTNWFYLWKYQTSTQLNFEARFGVFYEPESLNYDDACAYLPGVRRKRSADEPQAEKQVQTYITITVEDEQKTSEVSGDQDLAILVGAVSGAAVVMLLAGVICLVAVLHRRRRSSRRSESSRASSTASIVPSKM